MSQEQLKLMTKDDLLRIAKLANVLMLAEAGVSEQGEQEETQRLLSIRRRAALTLHHALGSYFPETYAITTQTMDYLAALNNVVSIPDRREDLSEEAWLEWTKPFVESLYSHLCVHEVIQRKQEEGEWPPPMTEDEVKGFVKDCVHGLIFTAHHIGPTRDERALTSVFMILALGAFLERADFELMNVGTFYEYISEAGPLSVNGSPTFMSVRVMNKRDWERCFKAIKAAEAALENVEL